MSVARYNSVALVLNFCLAAVSGAFAADTTRHEQVNATAVKLLKLDAEARSEFNKEHPGVLPDRKLSLPKATANAFDWCNLNKVSEAHHQLTGDCWANAAVEALECSNLIRNNRRVELSPQPVIDHLRNGAAEIGGSSYEACDYLLKTGTARLSTYPYTGKPAAPQKINLPYRACAWGYVVNDDNAPSTAQLKQALLRHGPVAISVFASPKFDAYKGGLFSEVNPPNPEHKLTNHVVLLVGWDDSRGKNGAWKVKNSWKPGWGEQGFMWIEYGINNIGRKAVWVEAQSTHYNLPGDFAKLVPEARPLPRITYPPVSAVARNDAPAATPNAKLFSQAALQQASWLPQ